MGEVVKLSDYHPREKEQPEHSAEIIRLSRMARFRLIEGELVQFPIQTCQQEPD